MNPIRVSVFSSLNQRPAWNRKFNISPSNSVFNQLHRENHNIGKRCCAYVKMRSTHNDTQNDELSYWPKALQLILKMNKSSFGSPSRQNIVKQAVSNWWLTPNPNWPFHRPCHGLGAAGLKNLGSFIFFSLSLSCNISLCPSVKIWKPSFGCLIYEAQHKREALW